MLFHEHPDNRKNLQLMSQSTAIQILSSCTPVSRLEWSHTIAM